MHTSMVSTTWTLDFVISDSLRNFSESQVLKSDTKYWSHQNHRAKNSLPMLCWRPRSSGIYRAARGGTSCDSRVGCFFSCTNTGAWSEPSSFTFLPPTHLCQVFQSKRSTTERMKMKSRVVEIVFTHLRWNFNMHPKFLNKRNLFQTYPLGHNPLAGPSIHIHPHRE